MHLSAHPYTFDIFSALQTELVAWPRPQMCFFATVRYTCGHKHFIQELNNACVVRDAIGSIIGCRVRATVRSTLFYNEKVPCHLERCRFNFQSRCTAHFVMSGAKPAVSVEPKVYQRACQAIKIRWRKVRTSGQVQGQRIEADHDDLVELRALLSRILPLATIRGASLRTILSTQDRQAHIGL